MYFTTETYIKYMIFKINVLDNMSKMEKEKVGGKTDNGINLSIRNYLIFCYKEREGRKDCKEGIYQKLN